MAKLTLVDIAGGYLSTAAINANYTLIEAALNNTLSRDGTSPNAMSAQLDMNSQRIVNLVDAVNNQEPVTLAQSNILAGVDNPLTQDAVGLVLWPDTAEETSAGVTTTKNYYENPDPRRYGAIDSTDRTASGVDNTAAFAAAVSVNAEEIPVKFRGQIGDLTLKNSLNGYGYGECNILAGATTMFNLVRNTIWGDWYNFQFKDIKINMLGDAAPRTIHAFSYPLTPSSSEKTLAGRNMWVNCIIGWADIAIYQPTGNFGNMLIGCHITNCNYGVWGQDSATPQIMHPGLLQIHGGEFSGHRKAAVYLNCDTETINGSILSQVSIEGNPGHGVYLDGINLCPDGLLLQACHFENNDSDSDGTIDLGFGRGSETIRDLMCWDVDFIRIIQCAMSSSKAGYEFHNSMALMDGCFMNQASILVQDSDSVVRCINANLDGLSKAADVEITSLVQQRRNSGANGATMIAKIPERTHIVKNLPGTGVGIFGQSYSHDAITLTGTGGGGTRTAGPNGLYPYYNKFTSFNASTGYVGPLFALVKDKWYVYSMMIRKSAFDLANVKYQNGTVHLVQAFEGILDNNVADDTWVTLGGVAEFSGTSGNARQLITTDSGSVPDVSLGPCQVVQFDTQHEAIEYFNSGAFYDADNLEYNGTALLSGGTLAIDFSTEGFQDQPDTDYNIQLTPDTSTLAYVSAKSATGFTITGSSTANVSWAVTRRDL